MDYIKDKIASIINNNSYDKFIFDFLLAYDIPKSNIDRARKWDFNKLEETWEFILRKKVHFKMSNTDLYSTIDGIKNSLVNSKSKPRFIIVTDFDKLLSFDTKVWDTLDIDFAKLDKNYDFFLPLIWVEKQQYQNENIADVKAANNLAKLFDEIVKDNDHTTESQRHALNIFLSRLLFCFFAEDTNIFKDSQFTDSLATHTKSDWSDTHIFLEKLFEIFNVEIRDDLVLEYLKVFPYVNGKLFQDTYEIPKFTTKSRKLLIELWQLDWSGINPDIFWSMMQAVMDSKERSNLWSHYTSVPNIMKVVQPLFLDDLYEAFEQCNENHGKLRALLTRISKIKFFDPACGSGNFLIIAYKEIRRLEIEIFKDISVRWLLTKSEISLSQFYGIEINDFAHETAKLSLYLAEHQMNIEFEKAVGIATVSLPLKLWGNIVCGNATRVDREEVCPKRIWDEIYIIGNPPYYGSRKQTKDQKNDMKYVFKNDYKSLDYISARFYLWANYIRWINAKLAFVSTNSISQWEQVALAWPRILESDIEINFAYQSFKWQNNAKDNANVIVVIIGLSNIVERKKILYVKSLKQFVDSINPYLSAWRVLYINKRKQSISNLPLMTYGNMPLEWGFLRFSDNEKNEIEKKTPWIKKFIRKVIWWEEFLKWTNRYCFWLDEKNLEESLIFDEIRSRVNKVKNFRMNWWEVAMTLINKSYQFRYRNEPINNQIVIPCTSTENRNYIPCAVFDNSFISLNSIQTIYDADHWILWVISSNMHMVWMKTVAGRLKTDFRYSSAVVYNTFPFPSITKKQKDEIEEYVYAVLDEREQHSEKTLAQMYDPDKMPAWLKSAHHELDLAIERCYRPKPFESDEERLEYLFKLYEKMIAKEKGESK